MERDVRDVRDARDARGFVVLADAVPDVVQEIRYHSTYNFLGRRVAGYDQPCALITAEAARALQVASSSLMAQGYRIVVFDAYRPQRAVDDFVAWARDVNDVAMKPVFYPDVDKSRLFELDYIAARSSHTRGSTCDITLLDEASGKRVDMGSPFDFFGDISHRDWTEGLTDEQLANRFLLRQTMVAAGFDTLYSEWWHFTLADEPYPDTYFDFPVRAEAAGRIWEG